MKKIIGVLALVLLFTASTQAATVLMDENFDSADYHVDLDTLPGWTNDHGSGVAPIFTTYRDIEPVDGGRGIYKFEGEYAWSNYSYAIAPHADLSPGEFYRFESYWHVTDGPANQLACVQGEIHHSDGRRAAWYYDPGEDLVAVISDEENNLYRDDLLPAPSVTDIRLRIDLDPDGVTWWYNLGEAPGSGWVLFTQALASDDPLLDLTGDITKVRVGLFSFTELDWPQADSFSLTVESSAAIPEPATLAVLALGGFAVLLRRKR